MVIIHRYTETKKKLFCHTRKSNNIFGQRSSRIILKHIQHTIHKFNTIVDKNQQKHMIQIKPITTKLNALIKTHKEEKPIRPVINNVHAPPYKLAKHLNKNLNQLMSLPYTYATKNSKEVAQELSKIQINDQHKIITLDIQDLYVNIPTQNIINITKFWLSKNINQTIVILQTLELIKMILIQNYFQYNDKYFKPTKVIAMGLPISSNIAEIYLQFFKELTIRHWMENGEISYYRRHVDDIVIIFDQNKINEELITNYMNNIHTYL